MGQCYKCGMMISDPMPILFGALLVVFVIIELTVWLGRIAKANSPPPRFNDPEGFIDFLRSEGGSIEEVYLTEEKIAFEAERSGLVRRDEAGWGGPTYWSLPT